ncbi:NUDIX hydrolase domain-like protein [Aspergillus pseudocaelatus]|uniref:NUDIX hydrolase domain-like protein n=1 Tax=Aspergillus pseudocaelatus TaxID=1825620 RepID=A0ABQ6WWK8_9EURO|nr:NUDIX hydrolase domain-like protein [Aspergillus pseudocaelatus]
MASRTNSPIVPSCELPSVTDITRLLFDLHCGTDLSTSRIAESCDQFILHHTACCIRVSAHIFLWDSPKPRILLIQRSLCDTKPGYWEVPAGSTERYDQTLQDALEREIREETGLQLCRVTHALTPKTWTRYKEGKPQEWVGLPYIVEISKPKASELHANSECVSQPVLKWEDIIRLNPEEHQKFAWATEDEVRRDEYETFGDHKETILEAFAIVTQNCTR